MIRPALAAALAALLSSCGPSPPPTIDVAPIVAEPAMRPLEWFAEAWGPMDPSLNPATEGARGLPVLYVDGRQVPNGPVVAGTSNALQGLEEDDIAKIVVVKCHSGAWLFGEERNYGVIMLFTHEWDGPYPILEKRSENRCRGEGP